MEINSREEAFAVLILNGLKPEPFFDNGWYIYCYPLASGASVCVGYTTDVDRSNPIYMSWGDWVQNVLEEYERKLKEIGDDIYR